MDGGRVDAKASAPRRRAFQQAERREVCSLTALLSRLIIPHQRNTAIAKQAANPSKLTGYRTSIAGRGNYSIMGGLVASRA